ncbi:hypothetical protein EJB05_47268 [Eragrostis curvula]|uniref:Secreted protein n=1 Tax=Eragrostis curvula TaxID=38414 RepID=A0A5J9T799_9POAL|nr:hypothetical protein EJB05_47268 [Eragrostis curvula]
MMKYIACCLVPIALSLFDPSSFGIRSGYFGMYPNLIGVAQSVPTCLRATATGLEVPGKTDEDLQVVAADVLMSPLWSSRWIFKEAADASSSSTGHDLPSHLFPFLQLDDGVLRNSRFLEGRELSTQRKLL